MSESLPVQSRVILVLPHLKEERVLTLGGVLPSLAIRGNAGFGVGIAGAAVALGLDITPLRRLETRKLPGADGHRQREFVWSVEGVAAEAATWAAPHDLPPEQRAWAEAALAPAPAARPLWQLSGGQARLMAWLHEELTGQGLTLTAEPQVLKRSQISALWRIETEGGPLYLKAVPDFFRREVPLTAALGLALPGAAPTVLAADTRLGVLLMQSGGEPLALDVNGWGESGVGRAAWSEHDSRALTRHLGRVQRASLPLLTELHALGLPQHDPPHLLARLSVLSDPQVLDGLTPAELKALERAVPRLEAALTRLARSPLPLTLAHHDLHEGNVARRPDGRFTLLDWSDAALGHPFLDANPAYLVPQTHREAAADAYLEVWADLAPLSVLRPLLADAALAGEYMRALGYIGGIYPGVEDASEWGGVHLLHLRGLLQLAE